MTQGVFVSADVGQIGREEIECGAEDAKPLVEALTSHKQDAEDLVEAAAAPAGEVVFHRLE